MGTFTERNVAPTGSDYAETVRSNHCILPLTELTKNRDPNIIPWNEAAEQAFTKLKAQLWATIEREAYAVIEALKLFDSWIFGVEIEVISDHNPLTYLTLTTPRSAKLTRWALILQRYNIAISYRKGIKHGNADALFRLPIPVS
ncbi:retrovirus-related Pol polyprotein from transposon 17.6 [Trichonephila clavipes]|nr:retrovirus-related Pol polyprotein from transposon 17.6 [Trichonephila clavipes]